MKTEKDLINTKHEGDLKGVSKMEKPKKKVFLLRCMESRWASKDRSLQGSMEV